ncbi:hypothetical protein EHF33_00255 [Deinococcus psychrotolerans]|uniref:Uncharacterized protein n=1 Tax=Deinococcus psychrotolerans TaxID=2489213 RepID=A0A3G8Y865_9DEIO|nr:hypothetical protein [Deinococcus psychrotolerans]AZI41375.1 hypothetical protein EHF33_00255 [Deinococcus psychrotolerans]
MLSTPLLVLLTLAGITATCTGGYLLFSRIKFGPDRQIDPRLILWPFIAMVLGDVGAGALFFVFKAPLWMPISVLVAGYVGVQLALLRRRSRPG